MKERATCTGTFFTFLTLICVSLAFNGCKSDPPESAATKKELTTTSEKLSYSLGVDIGASIAATLPHIDFESLVLGIEDRIKGKELLLTPEESATVKLEFSKLMHEKRLNELKSLAEKNLLEGKRFLAENKKVDGVITTESGLQYEVLVSAKTDLKPSANDRVKVNYRGTLLDGTEFDSSYKRNSPSVFPLNDVIPGWREALQMMSIGSKLKLYIPPELAYGEQSAGPYIGPNATVIYEVELLGIEKQETVKPAPDSQ